MLATMFEFAPRSSLWLLVFIDKHITVVKLSPKNRMGIQRFDGI